jgi:hypothetical protein
MAPLAGLGVEFLRAIIMYRGIALVYMMTNA